jgi:hypothetical protein
MQEVQTSARLGFMAEFMISHTPFVQRQHIFLSDRDWYVKKALHFRVRYMTAAENRIRTK